MKPGLCADHRNFTVSYDTIRGGGCPVCRAEANHRLLLAARNKLEKEYDALENILAGCNNGPVKAK